MITVLVIPVDSAPFTCDIVADDHVVLHGLVGGDLQAVMIGDDEAAMYLGEDGKIRELEPNRVATRLWQPPGPATLRFDVIVGAAVVVGPVDEEGSDTDVPDAVVQRATGLWRSGTW